MSRAFALFVLLCTGLFGYTQTIPYAARVDLTASSTITGQTANIKGSGVLYHQISWVVNGTVSACSVQVDSSSDGVSWTAGGAVASTTCTSSGASAVGNAVTNYIRIVFTAFTGTGTVSASYSGFTTNPSSGTVTSSTVTTALGYTPTGTSGNYTNTGNWVFSGNTVTGVLNSVFYPQTFPSTCTYQIHFGGVLNTYNGTTQFECAALAAAYAADNNNRFYDVQVPSGYNAVIDSNCLIEPDNGGVNFVGHGRHNYKASRILNSGCTGYMVQYSPNNFVWGTYIRDITFDGNGQAAGAIYLQAALQAELTNIETINFDGTDAVIKMSNSYEIVGNSIKIQGSVPNNLTVSAVTCTSDSSGNLSGACTITNGGANYTSNAHLVAFLEGPPTATTANPCTTMPSFTLAQTAGAITTVTASGGSGCANSFTYPVLVFDMPTNPYAISSSSTDYIMNDVVINGVGRTAGVNVTGGDATYNSLHGYYIPKMTVNSSNLVLNNPRYDSIFLTGSEFNSGGGTIVHAPFYTQASSLGLTYPYWNPFLFDAASRNVTITDMLCAYNTFSQSGYYQFLTSGGVVNNPPSDTIVLGNRSCNSSLYTASDYLDNPIASFVTIAPATRANSTTTAADSPRLVFQASKYTSGTTYDKKWDFQLGNNGNFSVVARARTAGDPSPTVGIGIADATAATASVPVPSPTLALSGSTWNGSASSPTNAILQLTSPTSNTGYGTLGITSTGMAGITLSVPQLTGPSTAPSGACSVNGVWVFSQDGHATYCNAGTWTTKI